MQLICVKWLIFKARDHVPFVILLCSKTNLDVSPAEFSLFSFRTWNAIPNISKVDSINHDYWIGQADPLNSHAQNRSQECAMSFTASEFCIQVIRCQSVSCEKTLLSTLYWDCEVQIIKKCIAKSTLQAETIFS